MTGEIVKAPKDNFERFALAMQSRIADVLPAHLSPERMARVLLAERTRNPKLAKCSTASLAVCVMLASQLGLEPSSPLGHFYLIPRGNECTALIGYKGLLELARRSGTIARINAATFYEDEIRNGTFRASVEPPSIEHDFSLEDIDRGDEKVAGAYCIVETTDGGRYQIILTRADIEERKKRSASKRGPWVTDFAAMARKSAVRALLMGGTVPLASEMPTAEVRLTPDQRLVRALHAEAAEDIAEEVVEAHSGATGAERARSALGVETQGLDEALDAEIVESEEA